MQMLADGRIALPADARVRPSITRHPDHACLWLAAELQQTKRAAGAMRSWLSSAPCRRSFQGGRQMMLRSTVIRTVGAISGFAVVHSLLATLRAKRRARRLVGARAADGLYRFAFNGFAVITLAATLRAIWPLPDRRLYRLRGAPALALRCGQLACAIALLCTNRQNGFGRVTGIRHASEFVRGQPISPPPVAQHPLPSDDCLDGWTGTFRLSSHPNNYLVLILYWLSPVMTVKWASIGLVTAVYMVLGSLHEDRRLLAAYGERYRCYRERVPHLALLSIGHWRAALRGGARHG
jgi:hypothetical protein